MIEKTAILYPALAMAGITLLVLLILGTLRMTGIATGRLERGFYLLFRDRDDSEPDYLRAMSRNYQNLLEIPVLFYFGCITAYATGIVTNSLVVLAWLYVVLRLAHTLIHIIYNRQWHRTIVFVVSSIILIAYLSILGYNIASGTGG